MAHNLRSRCVAEQLLEDDGEIEAIDLPSSGEEDNLLEDSEEDECEPSGSDSTESASEEDDYLENSSLEQRLLDVRARQGGRGLPAFRGRVRGRPSYSLRGKNNYKWDTRIPERHSGE